MSLALVLLMIPVVVRSTEEMLKLVPNELREASYALGVPKWRTMSVVLPTAFSGIMTGVLLGLARVMGETAPLLILGPYSKSINTDLFSGFMAALPDDDQPGPHQALDPAVERVWAAALTLVLLVLVLNLAGRCRASRLGQEVGKPSMAKRIDIKDLNAYYGGFKAVEDVTMTVEPRSVTAFIGPSGCGKSTFLRTLNRMHEVIPGARVEGTMHARRPRPVLGRRRPGRGAPDRRHGVPAPQPVPDDDDVRQRRRGPAAQRRQEKLAAGRGGREVAARRQPVERGQGPAGQARRGPVRRPAAAAVHRPRHRRRAAGAADGRAVLGPRPDLDPGHRGPDRTS